MTWKLREPCDQCKKSNEPVATCIEEAAMNPYEPAFPLNELSQYDGSVCAQHFGVDVRTHIAIAAMQGMLANSNGDYAPLTSSKRRWIVNEAWLIADDMIAHGQATAMPTQRG